MLDTNVVLDGLWFADARAAALFQALRSGRLQWLATEPMRRELELVLDRQPFSQRASSKEHVLTSFDSLSARTAAAPPAPRLLCTDPDDQKFIDLAVASQARWLFSRDRAVLKLARCAAAFGLVITVPERWPGAASAATGSGPGT